MRNTFAKEITKLAQIDQKIVLLSGDIGNRMFDDFKKIANERFINCGIAEANMMSIASGLALTGMKPFIYTITPFTTCRCLEQIKIGAAYHNAQITIVGTGSGLSYAELGPTHHSLEDMGIINSIPNMRILAPCDSVELKNQLTEVINLGGPTYIRIGKKGEPNLIKPDKKTKIGKAEILENGNEILILGVGPILGEALKAKDILEKKFHKSICIASLGGVSPIDYSFLEKMIERDFKSWYTLEEHGLNGGLGSTVNNWLINSKNIRKVKINNICTPNKFIHNLGTQSFMRELLKINAAGIIERIISQ